MSIRLILVIFLFSTYHASASDHQYVCFGKGLSQPAKSRLWSHLNQVTPFKRSCEKRSSIGYTLVFGIHPDYVSKLDPAHPEGFILNTKKHKQHTFYIAHAAKLSSNPNQVLANQYASYALLEKIGFSFLHPLEPFIPKKLTLPESLYQTDFPHWPVRTWHVHTQHPIELTNVLNGWGESSPEDKSGWEAMIPQWERFLEWAVANRQNRVSWFLLRSASWSTFADSEERKSRLRRLITMAHEWHFKVGLVAPIAFKQQHAWTMIRQPGNEKAQIRHAIDWLASLNIDFIEVESGYSEFTHPSDKVMLEWMNHTTRYAEKKHNLKTYMKVHISTGQVAESFVDPVEGDPLNFNFLPFYADRSLGVMPHTVQFYGLNDPAPTYGNETFSPMLEYIKWEAGRREVLWYPETAYWVSFDVDVPLFLPIYAQRRLSDLRLIGKLEQQGKLGLGRFKGSRIDGQVNFSSGWEWGYWLNDMVTARSVWNPNLHLQDDEAFKQSLQPFTRIFGPLEQPITQLLADYVKTQEELLIFGRVNGRDPESIVRRTGQAYLQGQDAWDDVAQVLNHGHTQPIKKGLVNMMNPVYDVMFDSPEYDEELRHLLKAMKVKLTGLWSRLNKMRPKVPDEALSYFNELNDSMRMTALRARQVYYLYKAANEIAENPISKGMSEEYFSQAQKTLDYALRVTQNRGKAYRVPYDQIAGWQPGPTAYPYRYLWTAGSLAYWWRDEAKVSLNPTSPCFMNILDPIDVANGDGDWKVDLPVFGSFTVNGLRRKLSALFGKRSFLTECMHKPEEELSYPLDGMR